MQISDEMYQPRYQEQTKSMLRELSFGAYHDGYVQLCIGIPRYAQDTIQGMCKELYPYIADELGHGNWHSVERSIRFAIMDAWERRDSEIWETYFPNLQKPPTNKVFIATLADRLK
ncbi:MAG: hypothetical protein IJZ39_10705 [Oscillospiraceae bacterium]|nr:hypothetical protein [Oscillospiraceae bacterium]